MNFFVVCRIIIAVVVISMAIIKTKMIKVLILINDSSKIKIVVGMVNRSRRQTGYYDRHTHSAHF